MSEARVHVTRNGHAAVLTMDGPPVNAFSLKMRTELQQALLWARQDESVRAVILNGAGKGFSAGGDISEFGTPAAASAPGLSSHIHVAIEQMGKPVIAVIHGFAMGGGLETALACHYRIAEKNAAVGLPEVGLGTLALSATQRLPRLLGVLPALKFLLEKPRHHAAGFVHTPLFDQTVDQGQGLATACALAADLGAVPLTAQELELRLVRNIAVPGANPERDFLESCLQLLLSRSDQATVALLQALHAAVRSEHFDSGLDRARQLFDALAAGEDVMPAHNPFLTASPGRSPQADHNDSQ